MLAKYGEELGVYLLLVRRRKAKLVPVPVASPEKEGQTGLRSYVFCCGLVQAA